MNNLFINLKKKKVRNEYIVISNKRVVCGLNNENLIY